MRHEIQNEPSKDELLSLMEDFIKVWINQYY
jgi:hypothetical protein